jgi:hypothetical protein
MGISAGAPLIHYANGKYQSVDSRTSEELEKMLSRLRNRPRNCKITRADTKVMHAGGSFARMLVPRSFLNRY